MSTKAPHGPRRRRPADLALTASAVLGVACLVVLLAGPLLGVRMLVFRSGSMAPTITAGSLALAVGEPVGQVRVGDVVAVREADGSRVTHRVRKREGHVLTLRGDANRVDDPHTYATTTVDRVVVHVPLAGYVVAWATSPLGLLCLAGGVLLLAGSATGRRPPTHRQEKVRAPTSRVRKGVTTCLVLSTVIGLGVLGPGQVRAGWATAWRDPVPMSSGPALTAATLTPTTVSCGVLQLLSTTLNWTAVTGATGYRLHFGTDGATTQDVASTVTSRTFTSPVSGVFWVEVLKSYGSVTWVSPISAKKSYTVVLGLIGTCG